MLVSVVEFTLLGFVIAVKINPNEPSEVVSSDDLANFASRRVSSLDATRHTLENYWVSKRGHLS